MNAAEQNSRRKINIDQVLLTKYQVETVRFKRSYNQPIEYRDDTIFIGDAEICLNFLRHFRHLIKKMSLNFDDKLFCHLNEYCVDFLIELTIEIAINSENQKILMKKPFSRIEVLEFNNCYLNNELTNFQKWFPQIRSIKFLNETDMADSRCMHVKFPHVKSTFRPTRFIPTVKEIVVIYMVVRVELLSLFSMQKIIR